MRTPLICAALSLALVGPVRAQTAVTGECSSHDHPCRLGLVGVTKCQVCHAHFTGVEEGATSAAIWMSTPVGDLRFSDSPGGMTGDVYLSAHTRMCVSCHDGVFGPRAEQCSRFDLAVRPSASTTRRMECGVCHDPHLDNRLEDNAKFLHHEETCGDCHQGEMFEELARRTTTG